MMTYEDAMDIAAAYLEMAKFGQFGLAMLRDVGYFEAPASKGHHLAVKGGLLIHSVNVTAWLIKLSKTMAVKWSDARSPYLVGMLHDFVKCWTYPVREDGSYGYQTPRWPGHGIASALSIPEVLGISLFSDESAAIVWHMGAFGLDKDMLRQYDEALNAFPLPIIATHTADMLASRVDERGE